MKKTKSTKIDSLQALRALAFGEIFLCHCEWNYMTGALGVAVFILLSGFCMQLGYAKKPLPKMNLWQQIKYGYQKIMRLYPLHIGMLLFLLWECHFQWNPKVLLQIFLLQSFSYEEAVFFSYNGVAWYLSTYLFLCIVAPWILTGMNTIKKKRNICIVMLGTAVCMALIAYVVSLPFAKEISRSFPQWVTYICPVYRVGDLTLGIGLALLIREKIETRESSQTRKSKLGYTGIEILLFLLVGISMYQYYLKMLPEGMLYTVLFLPVGLLAIYLFTMKKGYLTKVISNPLVIWIGNMSAYMFLIHQICIERILQYFRDRNIRHGYYYGILLSFGISLMLAWIYQFFISVVFHTKKKPSAD